MKEGEDSGGGGGGGGGYFAAGMQQSLPAPRLTPTPPKTAAKAARNQQD